MGSPWKILSQYSAIIEFFLWPLPEFLLIGRPLEQKGIAQLYQARIMSIPS